MKVHPALFLKRGFTLMELMVAMAITTIIVTVLVSITAMATDVWNRSRAELRASRQAKAMVDTMARDFESIVTRRGNNDFEWLSAINSGTLPGDTKIQSSNACDMVFFSGSMDRYDGNIGNTDAAKGTVDKGGDVSGIGYRLEFTDPIDKNGNVYKTFVFKRLLVNPDETFKNLLGVKIDAATPAKDPLSDAFKSKYSLDLAKVDNFICENIYQFTITFHVVVTRTIAASGGASATTQTLAVPVSIGKSTGSAQSPIVDWFKIAGTGIIAPGTPSGLTAGELQAGRVSAIEISITVITDSGLAQLSRRTFTDAQKADLLMKNSYNYVKRVQVSSM